MKSTMSKIGLPVMVAAYLMVSTMALDSERVYIRYKRNIERENSPVPSKESTLLIQGFNGTLDSRPAKDFENEITHSEKDCKDFVEFDYNPLTDSMLFTGRIPSLFNTQDMELFGKHFQQMFAQTQRMFNELSNTMPKTRYPDNFNGTDVTQVVIDGKKFLKKQHIINKTTNGTKISIMSTVYEPVENAEESTNSNSTARNDLTDGEVISY